jgi:hypothetical protein
MCQKTGTLCFDYRHGKKSFLLSKRPDRFWGSLSILFNGYKGRFPEVNGRTFRWPLTTIEFQGWKKVQTLQADCQRTECRGYGCKFSRLCNENVLNFNINFTCFQATLVSVITFQPCSYLCLKTSQIHTAMHWIIGWLMTDWLIDWNQPCVQKCSFKENRATELRKQISVWHKSALVFTTSQIVIGSIKNYLSARHWNHSEGVKLS